MPAMEQNKPTAFTERSAAVQILEPTRSQPQRIDQGSSPSGFSTPTPHLHPLPRMQRQQAQLFAASQAKLSALSFSVRCCTKYLLLLHFVLSIFFRSILYYASFSVRFCIMYLFLSHIVLCIFFCSMFYSVPFSVR